MPTLPEAIFASRLGVDVMSERPIAGRIWAGWLRVTASMTAGQEIEFVGGIVQEAVYFEFGDGHPDHGDRVDLSVGLCDDPIEGGGMVVLQFPAVVTIYDWKLGPEKALALVAGLVRETIDGWYERPEDYILILVPVGE
jgi:hypothetical protein